MTNELKKELQIYATEIRMGVIEGTYNAKAGHPGGSLSAADVLAYLYGKEMRYDAKNPKDMSRDRFVLSKGHGAPAVPGIGMSTGSLGQGVSAACGMAKGAKYLGSDVNIYTLLGDGEIEEGQVWEALMFASQYNLDNLCVMIDVNGLQIDGKCEDVMSAEPIDEKVKAFGFDVVTIDGNDLDEIEGAFEQFHKSDKPFAIILKTVKGKGVSYMENAVDWHGKAPNEEEYKIAMAELTETLAKLKEA